MVAFVILECVFLSVINDFSIIQTINVISQLYSSHLLFKGHSVCKHREYDPD